MTRIHAKESYSYMNIFKRSNLMLSSKVKIIVKASIRMLRLGAVVKCHFRQMNVFNIEIDFGELNWNCPLFNRSSFRLMYVSYLWNDFLLKFSWIYSLDLCDVMMICWPCGIFMSPKNDVHFEWRDCTLTE